MTDIIQNLITEFVKLNFGWGAWLIMILILIGSVVIAKWLTGFVRKIMERRKKNKKSGGK